MKREIVKIDRELCNGCGECIPNCHEGALQMIDGKATLVSELMCDGLGACIGHCPVGAIEIEEREAEAYDEVLTIKEMIKSGRNVVVAHLKHLKEHEQKEYVHQAFDYMKANAGSIPFDVNELLHEVQQHGPKKEPQTNPYLQNLLIAKKEETLGCGCPGSAAKSFVPEPVAMASNYAEATSQLSHWPVQMHLINPMAPFFQDCDLLLSADCVAYALGNFHTKYLKGKKLAIACPKLDSNKEVYVEKLVHLIDQAQVNTITLMKMEVPCCSGLLQIVQTALGQSQRKVPVKLLTVSSKGEILEDRWL